MAKGDKTKIKSSSSRVSYIRQKQLPYLVYLLGTHYLMSFKNFKIEVMKRRGLRKTLAWASSSSSYYLLPIFFPN